MGEKEIMTVREVAQFLQLSRNTIYKLVKEGRIPGVMVGNKLLFSRAKVLEALEAGLPEAKKAEKRNSPKDL